MSLYNVRWDIKHALSKFWRQSNLGNTWHQKIVQQIFSFSLLFPWMYFNNFSLSKVCYFLKHLPKASVALGLMEVALLKDLNRISYILLTISLLPWKTGCSNLVILTVRVNQFHILLISIHIHFILKMVSLCIVNSVNTHAFIFFKEK